MDHRAEVSRHAGLLCGDCDGFAVCDRCGRAGPNSEHTLCNCAYFIDPRHWGLGYASEAMGAFLDYFMRKFDLCQVEADHFDDNPASGAVLRKLGFQEIGKGAGKSQARLEPAPVTLYRLRLDDLKAVL